jgi:hypothetical protein
VRQQDDVRQERILIEQIIANSTSSSDQTQGLDLESSVDFSLSSNRDLNASGRRGSSGTGTLSPSTKLFFPSVAQLQKFLEAYELSYSEDVFNFFPFFVALY